MSGAPPPVKLLARDTADMDVISAMLQDAVIAVRDMEYIPAERRFVMIANRFRWESADRERDAEGTPIFERVHCGVCFEGVTAARQLGLVQRRPGQIVSLLSVSYRDGAFELAFSAGITVRLDVESLLCHFQDLDEPWPTQWRPTHPLDE